MGLRIRIRRALDFRFRPIFLTGVAGSGTTLSSGLLDQHFEIGLALHESAREAKPVSPLYMRNIEWHDSLPQYYRNLFFPGYITPRDVRKWAVRLYRGSTKYPKTTDAIIDKAPNTHMVRMGTIHEAFPESRVLLVFRDPVSNIEGLRRKWPRVFGGATIDQVCDYWEAIHAQFEKDVEPFKQYVRWYEYEELVKDPDGWLEEMAAFCELEKRKTPRQYKNKPNQPGKGLRNVSDGVIEVVQTAVAPRPGTLSEAEISKIRSRLGGVHEALISRARQQDKTAMRPG